MNINDTPAAATFIGGDPSLDFLNSIRAFRREPGGHAVRQPGLSRYAREVKAFVN
jgi:hypothetical protein